MFIIFFLFTVVNCAVNSTYFNETSGGSNYNASYGGLGGDDVVDFSHMKPIPSSGKLIGAGDLGRILPSIFV